MSRGKAGAIQTLKEELDKKLEELKESHEKEKNKLHSQWEEEMRQKLLSCEKDKQVGISEGFLANYSYSKAVI